MKKEYMTGPKKFLLDFLREQCRSQFTIEQICENMSGNGAPAKSTIYRLINRMVEDGTVRRFIPDNSRHFLYQYSGCSAPESHLHLKCLSCGRLVHMEDEQSAQMQSIILKSQHFELDENKTLLYGRCDGCRKNERPKK